MRTNSMVSGAVLALAIGAGSAHAQDFNWSGRLAQGQTIEVRGVNVQVSAIAASGDEVRVTATKREGRRGDAEDVRIEVVEHNGASPSAPSVRRLAMRTKIASAPTAMRVA
ncbi:MAG: hypothetical protein ACRELX_08815 [Longimicrobiales bacterium]